MYILNKQQQLKGRTLQNSILGQSTKNTDIFKFSCKKGLTALGLLLTQQILLFEHFTENNFTTCGCDALRDLRNYDSTIDQNIVAIERSELTLLLTLYFHD